MLPPVFAFCFAVPCLSPHPTHRQLHSHCVGISRSVLVWANLVRTYFAHKPAATRWNMMRYMLAAMHIHYATLRREEDDDGVNQLGIVKEEWNAMRRTNLLNKAEVAELNAYLGSRTFLASAWALDEIKMGILRDKPEYVEGTSPQPAYADRLTEIPQLTVFNMFANLNQEFATDVTLALEVINAPIPFPYFHLVKFLILVSLLILSYALIELLEAQVFLSITTYATALIITIGLEQIAIAMSDPFGLDDVDFELEEFIRAAYDNSVALLLNSKPACGEILPVGIDNPLRDNPTGLSLRSWEAIGAGLTDERESPRAQADAVQRVREQKAAMKRRSQKTAHTGARVDSGAHVPLIEASGPDPYRVSFPGRTYYYEPANGAPTVFSKTSPPSPTLLPPPVEQESTGSPVKVECKHARRPGSAHRRPPSVSEPTSMQASLQYTDQYLRGGGASSQQSRAHTAAKRDWNAT
jgi:hypothetical protein